MTCPHSNDIITSWTHNIHTVSNTHESILYISHQWSWTFDIWTENNLQYFTPHSLKSTHSTSPCKTTWIQSSKWLNADNLIFLQHIPEQQKTNHSETIHIIRALYLKQHYIYVETIYHCVGIAKKKRLSIASETVSMSTLDSNTIFYSCYVELITMHTVLAVKYSWFLQTSLFQRWWETSQFFYTDSR